MITANVSCVVSVHYSVVAPKYGAHMPELLKKERYSSACQSLAILQYLNIMLRMNSHILAMVLPHVGLKDLCMIYNLV